jgi:hypothetical protein
MYAFRGRVPLSQVLTFWKLFVSVLIGCTIWRVRSKGYGHGFFYAKIVISSPNTWNIQANLLQLRSYHYTKILDHRTQSKTIWRRYGDI